MSTYSGVRVCQSETVEGRFRHHALVAFPFSLSQKAGNLQPHTSKRIDSAALKGERILTSPEWGVVVEIETT